MKVTVHKFGNSSAYVEGEVRPAMRGGFVPDAVYPHVLDNVIIAFTDALIVSRERRTCFLARRAIRPMRGLWEIGGRRNKGETPIEGMVRNFRRETALDMLPERFVCVMVAEYLWQDREHEPCENSIHYMGHQFVIDLIDEEICTARIGLELREYDREFGLQEFTREQMVAEGVHPALIDVFDAAFVAWGPLIADKDLVREEVGGLSGHDDARRTIADLYFDPHLPLRHSKMVTKVRMPVGNHFHDCLEQFVLEAGKIEHLMLKDPSNGQMREWHDLGPGTSITIPAGVAHVLIMEPGSVLHMYVHSAQSAADQGFFRPYRLL